MTPSSPVVRAARTSRWAAGTVLVGALAAGCTNNGLPESATSQGDEVTSLWGVFLWLAVAVAALIWLLTAFVIISSLRRRRRDGADAVPRQKQYNTRLEIVYTAIPLVLVGVLFWMTTAVNAELDAVSDDPDLTVEVIGFQWQWQFRYPEQNLVPGGPLVVSGAPGGPQGYPELVLPVGATVRFELTADDVIHSFWVPEFLEKRDLIPGVDEAPANVIEVEVTRAGTWAGRCAEYCGLNHWEMAFTVRAVPADEFDAWVRTSLTQSQPMVAGSVPGTTATTNPVSGA